MPRVALFFLTIILVLRDLRDDSSDMNQVRDVIKQVDPGLCRNNLLDAHQADRSLRELRENTGRDWRRGKIDGL